MAELKVWAPGREAVAVQVHNALVLMRKNEQGDWTVDIPEIQHGADYQFVLDGDRERAFPDPRSPWQPYGVHGPSRYVDHAQFQWSDQNWQAGPLSSAVIYELHIGTFTPEGTFEAAIEKLDYLVDLGITHVELMPVAEFPGEWGWGYDGVDLYAPHHVYGGPDGLKRLVNACHQKGLAVLLDVVYNHLGPDGNNLREFGPYYTDRYHNAWGDAINFDGPGSAGVRQFFIDNARMWLRDYHFDGLRLDAVHAILDNSAIHFLEEFSGHVQQLAEQLGRRLVLIAESDLNDPRIVTEPQAGGYGIDAQWSDDFHHALHAFLTGEQEGYYCDFGPLELLAKSLQDVFVYDGCYSKHRQRNHGRPVDRLSPTRFLGYLQNHDQVGNRALGERIHHLVDPELVKVGAALVILSPFIPMIFQGEEWGASTPFQYFTDHQNQELGEAVREGRRSEFSGLGWESELVPDPQSAETFQNSVLNWDEIGQQPHKSILEWYRQLIQTRRAMLVQKDQDQNIPEVDFDAQACWLVLKRESLILACNFSQSEQTIELETKAKEKTLILNSNCENVLAGIQLKLAPYSAAVLG